MRRNQKISDFILKNLEDHPTDILDLTLKKFQRSRQTIHWHLSRLVMEGKICKVGKTRGTQYYLNKADSKIFQYKLETTLDENQLWEDDIKDILKHLPENVKYICRYGFTEMVNNVIDHSEAKKLTIQLDLNFGRVQIQIGDDGIGIFERIRKHFGLSSVNEAILHLSKGKVTTDPSRHSGEGIFFTSRMFEEFSIFSGHMFFKRFSSGEDWLLEEADGEQSKTGTSVTLQIPWNSSTDPQAVFAAYTSEADDGRPGFQKTRVSVLLSKNHEESYISRSQARRVLMGLEKFREVVLDFQNIKSVGQGFVDEVFRVFKNQNPRTEITWINANPEIEFMITRGVPS